MGHTHRCNIGLDDTLACWGTNTLGESTPPSGAFKEVTSGERFSCAIRADLTVACWGDNGFGQSAPPAGTFSQLSAGQAHVCGVRSTGVMTCWGSNVSGQATPVFGSYQAVESGFNHTCGLRVDGSLACWGNNIFGEATAPAGTFSSISLGGFHSCGIRTDGNLFCWGYDGFGLLLPQPGTFKQVSSGYYHSCALRIDGVTKCWGFNTFGQTNPPVGYFRDLQSGPFHNCTLDFVGGETCWGEFARQTFAPATVPAVPLPPLDRLVWRRSATGHGTCGGTKEVSRVRRLAPWLGLAVVLHVPLAPLVDWSPVAAFFRGTPRATVPAPVTEIPVDLVDDVLASVADAPATPEQPATSKASAPVADAADDGDAQPAPAPVVGKKRPRAKQRKQAAPAVAATARSSAASSAKRASAPESIADPSAALGDLKLASSDGSVRLLLHVDRLRDNALAAQVGGLLRGVLQWRGLFQDGALEPTRDIDRLLLVAATPRDSRSFFSVFDYSVQRFQVRQAVAGEHRQAYAFPAAHTLVIGPRSAQASAESLPRSFRLPGPSAGELLVLHVDQPARALEGLPLALPTSLRWARAEVTLTSDGGARVALLARDASAATAAQSAELLTSALGTSVVADAERLRATLELTPEAVQSLLQSGAAAFGLGAASGAEPSLPREPEQAGTQEQASQQ